MCSNCETLKNGATVIERQNDIVLAKWYGEYVTWAIDPSGDTYWGHYHNTDLEAAVQDFNQRCGTSY